MKGLSISIFVFFLIMSNCTNVSAQRDSRSDDDQNVSSFEEKFWWGANVGLQFSGGRNQSFFLVSLEPMLGYKLDENGNFSVGPRLSAEYSSSRFAFNTNKVNSLNFGGGIFGRAKIYRGYFAHLEYEKVNQKIPETNALGQIFIDGNGEVQTKREWRDNYFLGGGISQGSGRAQFEILILINLKPDDGVFDQQPVEYRTGFTVNF